MSTITSPPVEHPESHDEETVLEPRFFSDIGMGKEVLEEILTIVKKLEKDMEELRK